MGNPSENDEAYSSQGGQAPHQSITFSGFRYVVSACGKRKQQTRSDDEGGDENGEYDDHIGV